MPIYKTQELFSLEHTIAAPLLEHTTFPWEALSGIAAFILALGPTLPAHAFDHPSEDVWIAKDAVVAPTALVGGPCIIDSGAEVRHCAFIRGGAIIGKGAVLGNSSEIKNSILFDKAQAPHFNYIGDSVLGHRAHLGAGAVTSNLKSDQSNVVIKCGDERTETGRRKLGAMVGDGVEVGCNSVLCPGSVLGPGAIVYPVSRVRGVVPAHHIFKNAENIVEKK